MVDLCDLTSEGAVFLMRRCRWLATEAVQVPEIYMVGSNYNFGIVIVIKVTSVLCNLRERGEKL